MKTHKHTVEFEDGSKIVKVVNSKTGKDISKIYIDKDGNEFVPLNELDEYFA